MTYFLGDLVVSVSGCRIDEKAGPLVDPCVELAVGNQLHSTSLPMEDRGGVRRVSERCKGTRPAVAFHGVNEGDVLTVTVLDRACSPASNGHEAFIAEAEPLMCIHWGCGGRPARRTCVVGPPEEISGVRCEGKEAEGRGVRGVSMVELAICWSPAIRLRRPLSLVAEAGRISWRVISRKVDRPVELALNLGLDAAAYFSDVLLNLQLRAAAAAALVASLSLGSACLAAWAALFLPVTLAVVALAVAMVPPLLALGWVTACTGPVCEQIWRPLLVWTGTRSALARRLLLLPMDVVEGAEPGTTLNGIVLGEEAVSIEGVGGGEGAAYVSAPPAGILLPEDRSRDLAALHSKNNNNNHNNNSDSSADRAAPDAGAIVLLLACCQNLVRVLHTGLEASRWRPRLR